MEDDSYKAPKTELEKKELRIKALEAKLESLGVKGEAKLYYSLNKNMADLSDILDNTEMSEINLSDPKDKTMERLKTIWAAITPLAETLKFLKSTAGITGDEEKDIKRSFTDRLATERK
jgi:hypothetical protein